MGGIEREFDTVSSSGQATMMSSIVLSSLQDEVDVCLGRSAY